jgi:hypothetical protein
LIPSSFGLGLGTTDVSGGCKDCRGHSSCGSYHVYVISLGGGTAYDFYVGQTGKSVLARALDNWTKYGSRGSGPRLVLVPEEAVSCTTRREAEESELELAESLRAKGYKVRGPARGA